jgi:MoaA/NifB/PqqE/SkfB family radical SAM enzyme
VFAIADLFRRRGMKLHLLTSGLALERYAAQVAARFDRVIVSLDAVDDLSYAEIRGVNGLGAIERGIGALQSMAPRLPVTARATLHGRNFRQLPSLISKARDLRLTSISFLTADVSSDAFGRPTLDRPRALLLSRAEIEEFRAIVDQTIRDHPDAFASHFVAESPARLRRLPEYYAAMLGDAPFPPASCDAPWVAAVVEANGDVRPCFFHRSIGNIRELPFREIVTGRLRAFRADLDVSCDPACERCVCSLNVRWSQPPWN